MGFSILRTRLFLRIFRSRLSDDLIFLLAVTLAAGFYSFEKSIHEQLAHYISWFTTLFAVGSWVWISFVSGFMKRGYFLAISIFYWTLPQFIIIGYASFSVDSYNAAFYISARISQILVWSPVDNIARSLQISGFFASMSLLILYELMFFLGIAYRMLCRNYGWYYHFRKQFDV